MIPSPGEPSPRTVGILIFPDVEVLDFCGPFEVFSVTRRDEAQRRETPTPFHVLLVGLTRTAVTTTGGMVVQPHVSLEDCPPLDLLLVPGGWGTRALLGDEPLARWLTGRAATVELLLSVCTGSLLLAQAGLLNGRRATTHWQSLDALEALAPCVTVVRDEHVVFEDGSNVGTSAGISAGIDLALRVVARLHGEAVARATARHMEYPFPDDNRRRL